MARKNKLDILLFAIKLRGIFNSGNRNLRKRIVTFLIFLMLASVSWLLRALQDVYVADIKYPVKYINLPANKILIEDPPRYLILSVRSEGYSILKNKIKIKLPVKFDVNAFSEFSKSIDTSSFYILTRFAREKLENELKNINNTLQIIDISPDTVFFHLTELHEVNVPLQFKPNKLNNYIEKGFSVNGPLKITPATVTISGPSYITDTIKYLTLEEPAWEIMNDTAVFTLEVKKIPKVKTSPGKVNLNIPIDRTTEREFKLSIDTRDVPDTIALKTFPSEVSVSVIVTLSYYDSISINNIKPYISYNEITNNETSALKVNIDSLPEFIQSPKIKPRYVEILRKRKSPTDRIDRGDW